MYHYCNILLCCLGGHTTEMIMLTKKLQLDRYSPLHFVTAHSDHTTISKLNSSNVSCCLCYSLLFESSQKTLSEKATWHTIHRLREVKQSWFTTVLTAIVGSFHSFLLILKLRPKLIICNGPGECDMVFFYCLNDSSI